MLFTDVGIKIVESARQVLHEAQQIREIAALARDPDAGELKIGMIPTLAPYFLPLIISQLTEAFPKLKLYLFEEQTTQLISQLSQGGLDAAILALPIIAPEFTSSHLFDESFRLAVAREHRLAKEKSDYATRFSR